MNNNTLGALVSCRVHRRSCSGVHPGFRQGPRRRGGSRYQEPPASAQRHRRWSNSLTISTTHSSTGRHRVASLWVLLIYVLMAALTASRWWRRGPPASHHLGCGGTQRWSTPNTSHLLFCLHYCSFSYDLRYTVDAPASCRTMWLLLCGALTKCVSNIF